ncbi:MAG: diguanylate cyclase [Desulfovibrio sp.]
MPVLQIWCATALLCLVPALCYGFELTQEEKEYLKHLGPITLCVDPDWIPFEHVDARGNYTGIAADLLGIVSRRIGVPFKLVRTQNWDESLENSRQGKCLLLGFLNQTSKRSEWLLFTEPLFSDPNVFITREEHAFIADPAELTGETIVFPSGTAMEERIRRDYPNLEILNVESEAQAIEMVSRKKADMTMRSLIVAAYTIKKQGLFNLKIAGQLPNYINELRVGVLRKEPMLRNILSKAIHTITPQERGRIVNEHVVINVQTVVDYWLILRIVVLFVVIGSVVLISNFRLKKLNAKLKLISQTDALTGLPNRMLLNARFHEYVERAQRYARPLSVILFDIDGFKRVNDELGHLVGDQILVIIGKLAGSSIRSTDLLGRWGGEEFLILCPESNEKEAMRVAERVLQAIRAGEYPNGTRQTVSAGVAAFSSGDTEDTLLQRADCALYRAKAAGKDRVENATPRT